VGIRPLRPRSWCRFAGSGIRDRHSGAGVLTPGAIFVKVAAGGVVLPVAAFVMWRRTRRTAASGPVPTAAQVS